MRRARTRRRGGVVAVVAAVLPLGGCGIPETDVIEAGAPASVQAFVDRDYDMLLFFRSPDGGLNPVVRSSGSSGEIGPDGGTWAGSVGQDPDGKPVAAEKVVTLLLLGPDERDRAAGLDTALPTAQGKERLQVEVSRTGTIRAELPIALEGLDSTALRQLICTIAYSEGGSGLATVRLSGTDGVSRSGTCGLDPNGG
ncbi:hypothetical protein [Streptomyces sp. NPDC058739]|uniref:hypothetical protein n=1 Tax=Streptomyces sp. NPDC058739 TaxID=3346618 RepID=UPI0036C8B171